MNVNMQLVAHFPACFKEWAFASTCNRDATELRLKHIMIRYHLRCGFVLFFLYYLCDKLAKFLDCDSDVTDPSVAKAD